jgi:TonB-linked SusC/RagA family outer membrane protein
MNKISFYKGGSAFWYLIIIGLLLSSTPGLANKLMRQLQSLPQEIQISGTITDGTNPLPGVTISIKGKATTVTISDFNGQYSLTASPDDILVFSFMGFKTSTATINGRKTINIQLQEDITSLQEVRVNAGYYSVKESERTGSITKITSKDIEKQPISNPLAALQGRMSGVNITQSTGTPGGGFAIQIRGLNSIRGTGNDPLYIVNGVPYASQSLGNAELTNGVLQKQSSPLNSINPSDIESLEVLKDADATAIYGSRGANGVVLITTKKGKVGKSRFSVQASTTVGKITNHLKLLNTPQYLDMRREAFENDGLTQYSDTDYDLNGTWDQTRNTNWQKQLIGGNSYISNVQLSLSGGTTETQYLLTGTWRDETTVFPGDTHYTKGAVHSSITHRSTDERFTLQFSADYSNDKNTLPGADLTRLAYTLAPNAPALYDENANLNWENGTFENPLSYLEGTYHTNTQNLIANTLLSYRLGNGFELKSSFGYTDTRLSEIRTRPSTMYNPIFEVTSADSQLLLNKGARQSWIAEPQISWTQQWGTAAITALAGGTFQSQQQESLALDGYGFASNEVINSLVAATTITILNHDITEYRYNALFGRLNVNWDGRYIVNLTARRDGSSRFGPDRRFANFGAVGAAWVFSKEKILQNSHAISFGKLRASYGITGNDQIGDYQYLDTYAVTTNNYDGTIGMAPTRLFNPDFGWETNKKLEAAIELGFLNDRIFLTVAAFRNRSGNQLIGVPLPGTTGFSSIQANLGATVENSGLEFDLRTVNVTTQNFKWSTSLNLSLLRNKLLEFPGLQGSTYKNTFVIGASLNIRKAYQFTGIDPETGLYSFMDFNNDGIISSNEDRKIIIDTTPEYFGGLSNQMSYKNWSLDFLFQFVKQQGTDVLATFPITGAFSNQPTSVLNNYPQSGADSTIQHYTTGENAEAITAFNNFTRSDAVTTDASFIRLKSITLSYELPSKGTKAISGRMYLQGQNLLTLTNYKGPDPENQSGVYLPPLRQITLGVQLSF